MLGLSMNELTTMRWSFEEDVRAYAEAGFDGIGIWRQKLSDLGEGEAIEVLKQRELRCSNLLWAGGFTGSDGCTYRDSVQDAVAAIQSAARLNADCLILYSGAWGGHTRTHARRLVSNALRELIPFAEEFGVTLALEPMHPGCGGEWTFLNTIEETLELIDSLESPYLKFALDTYHYGLQHPNLELLSDVTHRIAVVHLGDGVAAPNGEQDRCQLGTGQVPLRGIIETLTSAGYAGFLDIELIGESVESIEYSVLIRDALTFAESLMAAP